MKIYIAIPCLEEMPVDFVKSLVGLEKVGQTSINFSVGSLVYASRDYLAQCAIAEKSDYIVWLDSDMTFQTDLLIDLIADVEGRDFVTAVCFRRKPPFSPVIYKKIRIGLEGESETEEFEEYPQDEMFEIDACGMAAAIMSTEMAAAIIAENKQLFAPIPGYGEDISFCIRAKKAGYKLWADPALNVGHITKTIADRSAWKAWKEKENGGIS